MAPARFPLPVIGKDTCALEVFFLSKIKEFLELRFSFSWKADNKSRPQADVRHPVAKFSKEHFNLFPRIPTAHGL